MRRMESVSITEGLVVSAVSERDAFGFHYVLSLRIV